ncbi:hypothetical protein QTP70_000896 [Hemibagrus guttatus]|uniref:Uncharacterized protein n=1 Tax=Hemibagrus guttatus TaxID=175788 RepID=A0AAE0QKX8_9TELE|nr:hypothetical protein QTP70_000896 [Hemibagrus guttatus]
MARERGRDRERKRDGEMKRIGPRALNSPPTAPSAAQPSI